MKEEEIKGAIEKAQKGIGQYLEIMEMLYKVDVSSDKEFQKRFNAFYRIRQRSTDWYETYYALMEDCKFSDASFDEIIDQLNSALGRYEPSFSSKLVATLNPMKPVWDEHVLRNTGHKPPSYQSSTKITEAKAAYRSIENWYRDFLQSDDGKTCVNTFNKSVFRYYEITDLKKVDFILWQIRA